MATGYEIITKLSDPKRVKKLAEQLDGDSELFSGGMAEFSPAPGRDCECACVYDLRWSTDKRLFGLEITQYTPVPDNCRGLDDEPYDGDLYLWSLDNRSSKTWIGAIAVLEEGTMIDPAEIGLVLENCFVEAAGIAITDVRCP